MNLFSVEGKFRGGVRSSKNGARIEWTQDGLARLKNNQRDEIFEALKQTI